MEIYGLCRNNTTLPLTQNSGQQHANAGLMNVNKTTKKQEISALANMSTSKSLPWNSLGAIPTRKSCLWEMGRMNNRQSTVHRDLWGKGLACRVIQAECLMNPSIRKQLWTAAKGRIGSKAPQQPSLQLENRFAPLSQDPGSLPHNTDNSTFTQQGKDWKWKTTEKANTRASDFDFQWHCCKGHEKHG